MLKQLQIHRFIGCAAACLAVSACQTVKMPKIDILKSPEFSEDAANISKEFPRVKDAPTAPDDIRSAKQWDRDARAMQALRQKRRPISAQQNLSEAEADAEFEALKARAQAYKKDDPASGPVEGFPDYKPRRKSRN